MLIHKSAQCDWMAWMAWPPLPEVLQNIYLKILRCIFSFWVSCWCLSRMGRAKPSVLRATGTSPLKSRVSADFLFPPLKCLGLRAPNQEMSGMKWLMLQTQSIWLWKTDFSPSPSSLKSYTARPFGWNVELPFCQAGSLQCDWLCVIQGGVL